MPLNISCQQKKNTSISLVAEGRKLSSTINFPFTNNGWNQASAAGYINDAVIAQTR